MRICSRKGCNEKHKTRGESDSVNRGAKIVADHQLDQALLSTQCKRNSDFGDSVETIRREGFESQYRQHVRDFKLSHKDSFRTLTNEESNDDQAC
jgi:NitT/TauT family transport system ATP-binding protein